MAGSVNRVFLMGNLTRDPEIRNAGSTTVASFGVAVNERYKDRDGKWTDKTTFVDCECWGNRGDALARYLGKGDPIFIEGRLQLDQWQDQQGNNRSKLKVRVDNFEFIGGRDSNKQQQGTTTNQTGLQPVAEDDIPF